MLQEKGIQWSNHRENFLGDVAEVVVDEYMATTSEETQMRKWGVLSRGKKLLGKLIIVSAMDAGINKIRGEGGEKRGGRGGEELEGRV